MSLGSTDPADELRHRRMEQLGGGGRLGRSEVGRNIDAGEEIAHMVTKIVMLRSEIANLLASLIL